MARAQVDRGNLWQRIHAFAGDDMFRTVRLAISVARQRHAG